MSKLDVITLLVENQAHDGVVFDAVKELFAVVDGAHSAFESVAKEKSARLIETFAGGGIPKEPPLVSWLTRAF